MFNFDRFQGGWLDFLPAGDKDGLAKFKYKGQVKDIFIRNGIFYSVKDYDVHKTLTQNDVKTNNGIIDVDLNFLDGSR